MSLVQDIMQKIESQELEPKPSWQFALRNGAWWFCVGVLVTLGAFGVAAATFNMQNGDWDIAPRVGIGWLRLFLLNLPYFWIAVVIAATLAAYEGLRRTKYGYRYARLALAVGTFMVSFAIGIALHTTVRAGMLAERSLQQVPLYATFNRHHYALWAQPERGLIAGEIVSPFVVDTFSLRDLEDKVWTVQTHPACVVSPSVRLQSSEWVKVIGVQAEPNFFIADEIRPLPAASGAIRMIMRQR